MTHSKLYFRNYYLENREYYKQRNKKYRESNPYNKEYYKNYYEKTKPKRKEYSKKYYYVKKRLPVDYELTHADWNTPMFQKIKMLSSNRHCW